MTKNNITLVAIYCHLCLKDIILYGEFVFNLYLLCTKTDEIYQFYNRKHNALSKDMMYKIKTISVNVGRILHHLYKVELDEHIVSLYKISYSNRFARLTDKCVYSNKLDSLNLPDDFIKETPPEGDITDSELTYVPFFNHLHILHYKEMCMRHYMGLVKEYDLLEEFKVLFLLIDEIFFKLWNEINVDFIENIIEGDNKMNKVKMNRDKYNEVNDNILDVVSCLVDDIQEKCKMEDYKIELIMDNLVSIGDATYRIHDTCGLYNHEQIMLYVTQSVTQAYNAVIATMDKINNIRVKVMYDHKGFGMGKKIKEYITSQNISEYAFSVLTGIDLEKIHTMIAEYSLGKDFNGSYSLTEKEIGKINYICSISI